MLLTKTYFVAYVQVSHQLSNNVNHNLTRFLFFPRFIHGIGEALENTLIVQLLKMLEYKMFTFLMKQLMHST